MMHILPRLLIPALFGIIVVLAMFFRGIEQALFAPVLGGAWLCAALAFWPVWNNVRRDARWDLPWAPLSLALLLFFGWIGLALFRADVMFVSGAFTAMLLLVPALFFTLTLRHDHDDKILPALVRVFAGLGAALSVWTIFQAAVLPDLAGGRIHHPFLNANDLGAFIAMGVPFALAMLLRGTGRVMVAGGTMVALGLVAIAMTESRGGFLAAGAVIVVMALWCAPQTRQRIGAFILTLVVAWAIWFALCAYLNDATTIATRFGGILGDSKASINERYLIWTTALSMAAHHPWTGMGGLASFYLSYAALRPFGDTSDGYFVHLDPLQFAVETGIPALIFFYLLLGVIAVRTVMAASATRDMGQRMAVLAPAASLLVLVLNAHLSFQLYMPVFLIPAGVLLAVWYAATEQSLGRDRFTLSFKMPFMRRAIFVGVMAGLVLTAMWCVRAGVGIYYTDRGHAMLGRNDFRAAERFLTIAHGWAPDSYGRVHYIDAVAARLRLNKDVLDGQDPRAVYDRAVAGYDRAIALNPYNAYYRNEKALLTYAASGVLEPDGVAMAEEILREALALDPLNFEVRVGLAQVYATSGRVDQAVAVLEDVMRWHVAELYAPPQYLGMLAQMNQRAGRTDRAAYYADKIAERTEQRNAQVRGRTGVDQWLKKLRDRLAP
ncbi:O-antigen ligase family protein [Micavibrio aeruginosavorus]|uniref:Putative bicarbonate transporter, ICT family n=1 Tax=Micavibrio aeruginosavorus EPB TaxID=349215 RepID=M4VFH5_9BACT|nr:O-antigen ligase family protein [Micavibrio aeruginosavorus]AGH97240.1 putative bicarbonate transporter, ICT family [Micavibrio aeruginosavorus EPB]